MSYDFQMESKLSREAPELHRVFSDNVLCSQNMLVKYQSIFPNYTDHTALHSLEVITFCNELIGDNIDRFNTDEIFVLLMAAYLHDSGMGISQKDYERFSEEMACVKDYKAAHPDSALQDIIRTNHNEFSGKYIQKYAALFDFPSDTHKFAIIQSSRGHRKTDLFDETEYPAELLLDNGNVIHLPYISALIRLADEIDIAADRNIQFLYDASLINTKRSMMEFKKHAAIKRIAFAEEAFEAYVDYSDPELTEELDELFVKLDETLALCRKVIEERTPFVLHQKCVRVIKL